MTAQTEAEPELIRTPEAQKRLREKLERDMKKFLKKGGKVKIIPSGVRSDAQPLPVTDDE